MIDRKIRNLRLDRRLLNRREWITGPELEEALEALPDVADKAELVTDQAEGGPGSREGGSSTPPEAGAGPLAGTH